MVLIALIVLALGFTTTGYIFKRTAIAFAAVGGWALLGFYALTITAGSWENWDIYYALFWLCMALVIVSAFEPIIMKPAKEEMIPMGLEEEDNDKELKEDFDSMNRQMSGIARLLRGGGNKPKERTKNKPAKFSDRWKT